MKKIIERTYCDICNKETEVERIKYPVIFHTEQNEGRWSKPYISNEAIDVCKECLSKILMLDGWGGQGNNEYKIRQREMGGEDNG